MATQEWATTSRSTTHGVHYTIRRKPMHYGASEFPGGRKCILLAFSIGYNVPILIRCFGCGGFSGLDEYFRHHRQLFLSRVLTLFPSIQFCCADKIAESLVWILQRVTINHQCLILDNATSTVVHIVKIHIQFIEDIFLMASFEEAELSMKPASKEFVDSLVTQKAKEEREESDCFEYGWTDNSHECVICMDEIQTRKSSLSMPCSHVFHEDCLVMWLNTSHVCPLCRYDLPTEDFDFPVEDDEDDSNSLGSLD